MSESLNSTPQWSSRFAFILVATGSAVGLGNIWKFPYIVGENGGGAFVLIYLVCIALIGLPIMMAEIMLGRRGGQNPILTIKTLTTHCKANRVWIVFGWVGVLAGVMILSYYSVIAGWAMAYVFRSLSGMFVNANSDTVALIFTDLVSSPEKLIAWHTFFMMMTIAVVMKGVNCGIEKVVKFIMPALFILLLILVFYAMQAGDFSAAVSFLFAPNFSEVRYESILEAMGHAFFTLSLGMGVMMTYGSYLPHNVSITKASVIIILFDTLIALLAGLAIFPIVFANGLLPSDGPGLIFNTLPIAFGAMKSGSFFSSLFFLLLVFAAWTSAVSLLEPLVAYLIKNRGMSRATATIRSGLAIWFLGLGTIFSFNIWSDIKWSLSIGSVKLYQDATFFNVLDYLTANIMLPIGGLFVAFFAGWIIKREKRKETLQLEELPYAMWMIAIKYVAPFSLIVIFLKSLNII